MLGLGDVPETTAATVQVSGLDLVLREDNRKGSPSSLLSSTSAVAIELLAELFSVGDALKASVAAVHVLGSGFCL